MKTLLTFEQLPITLTLLMFALTPVLMFDMASAADTPAAAAAPGKTGPVRLEPIAGGSTKRITLTQKAAERLDIQTGQVGSDVVVRKQMVSGMVIYPQATVAGAPAAMIAPAVGGGGGGGLGSFGGFNRVAATATASTTMALTPAVATAPAMATTAPILKGESWVVVSLSPGEFDRINKDKPARISPLYTRDKSMQAMDAVLSDQPPTEDGKRSMLTLRYKLPSSDHGLAPSTRVRVELQLAGSEDKQKTVPYSAVYYDAKGAPWVYVNTAPLVYERQRVTVQRVVGHSAVISDGPTEGAKVVTVGAALLYGTEIFGK
jgi:hypothetical protein